MNFLHKVRINEMRINDYIKLNQNNALKKKKLKGHALREYKQTITGPFGTTRCKKKFLLELY